MSRMSKEEIEVLGKALAETIRADLRLMMAVPASVVEGLSSMDTVVRLQQAVREERVNCFGDLHDVMDANVIGNTEGVWGWLEDSLAESVVYMQEVGSGAWTTEEVRVQTRCDVINVAQDEVDHWIKKGGLREP